MKLFTVLFLLLGPAAVLGSQMNDGTSFNDKQASHFAALALKCVAREYPNKPEHVINNAGDVKGPQALHPAFYGCYDWHSSVHGHWMLVRLLKAFPGMPEAAQVRSALDKPTISIGCACQPGYFLGSTMKALTPRAPASGSVFANSTPTSV